MSNYWNKLSPLHGTVTKRQSHATGGIAFKAGSDRAKSVKEKEKKNNRKRKKFETPYHGRWSVSKETFEEARKDVGDIKGKSHHLKAHKKEGKKRLKKIKKKSDYSPFYSEKVLKSAFPDRDKGWGGKHSRKIEHNAKGGRVGLKQGGKPVKTLVAGFVGKAKDWPGAKAVKKLNKKGRTRK